MIDGFSIKYKNVYFIGIGGISMSGLAEILKSRGVNVAGTDMKISDTTKHLENLGVKVNIGHSKENITKDFDLVVYTAAVKEDNPELLKAKELSIDIMDRAELLGHIMADYENSVAVSGTHGKTTTTSMVSEILLCSDTDPTISVGGILPSIGGNTKVGSSKYFVAEACEYFDSFLKFNPLVGIILNIEADHLDYFKTFENVKKSFHKFAMRIPKNGTLIVNDEIEDVDILTKDLNCKFETYSTKNSSANWFAKNIIHHENGKNTFTICHNGEDLGEVTLNIPGEHNISNALGACGATFSLGVPFEKIAQGLMNYGGTNRRFQRKGMFDGVTVIDDYAHHPTEIKATLTAGNNVKHNRLWCVFQPHTYTRTYNLFDEFTEAFDDADKIIIADIYAAREKDTGLVNSKALADKIKEKGKDVTYIGSLDDIVKYLKKECKEGDLLITMGAGDVNTVGERLVSGEL